MQADGRHYAVVADQGNEAVHIMNISDPDQPDIVSTAMTQHQMDLRLTDP